MSHQFRISFVVAACVLGSYPAWSATPSFPSLCAQLASNWKTPAGPADAIRIDPSPRVEIAAIPDTSAVLILDSAFKEEFGDVFGDEKLPFDIQHLAGTPVYRGVSIQGSGHCLTSKYFISVRGKPARALQPPASDTSPCTTPGPKEGFGTVSGRPAYIESGRTSDLAWDRLIRITPWEGTEWGTACRLTVKMGYQFRIGENFHGDQAAYVAAKGEVPAVAAAYLAFQMQSPQPEIMIAGRFSVPDFHYGTHSVRDPAVLQAWQILIKRHDKKEYYPFFDPPTFPTFKESPESGDGYDRFSDYNFTLFPWSLQGHLYIGALGHVDGPSWSPDTDTTLIAVYQVPQAGDESLVPLASFVVNPVPDRVRQIEVLEGDAAKSAPASR